MEKSWVIRFGRETDWRALRLLLPGAFHLGSGTTPIVAAEREMGLVVGVAAMASRLRLDPVTGTWVDVHVIPPYRRRGIGRELIDACATAARVQGARALYAWAPMPVADPRVTAWKALGFERRYS
jgi:GNAT superfamily N-acetyltransferase